MRKLKIIKVIPSLLFLLFLSTAGALAASIGDITGDGKVDIEDSIVVFQVLAVVPPATNVYLSGDANGDHKIGIEEAIYVLQVISGVRPSEVEPLSLESISFSHSESIPTKYTADGTDVSPQISWNNAPAITQSFVLIMDDPDAPGGTWDHWIVYDIPPSTTSLEEAAGALGSSSLPAGAKHGANSWSNNYYQGPSPPAGSGTHRYYFKLYALSVSQLNPANTSKVAIEAAMAGKIVSQAELMGIYNRPPSRVVACGETITEDTRLGADLVCPQGSPLAITIGASNITLDLGGHTITGYPPATGVFALNIDGLLIRNGTIDGFEDGIFIIGTRRVSFENLTVKNQSVFDPDHQIFGIHIDGSHDVVVKRVLFEFPSVAHKEAVVIYESEVSVRDIEVRGGGAGVNFSFAQACDPLQGPSNGEVVNSKFSEIYVAGILVACSSGARLADNDISTAPGVGVGIQGDAPFSGAVTGLTVEGNSIHDAVAGIEFRGIIESTVSNNLVSNNAGPGIEMAQSLGCIVNTPGWECFYSTANVITDNQATGNGTDLYHHENSTGNTWERNTCETKHGVDIPECTITESAIKK